MYVPKCMLIGLVIRICNPHFAYSTFVGKLHIHTLAYKKLVMFANFIRSIKKKNSRHNHDDAMPHTTY